MVASALMHPLLQWRPIFFSTGGRVAAKVDSDSPALIGSNVTFVVTLQLPKCQTEDNDGNIVYKRNCTWGRWCQFPCTTHTSAWCWCECVTEHWKHHRRTRWTAVVLDLTDNTYLCIPSLCHTSFFPKKITVVFLVPLPRCIYTDQVI